jgi:ADP-ribosylglycohydrolase
MVAILRGALVGEALGRPFVGLKPGRVEQLLGGARPEGFLASGAIQSDKPERNVLPGLHGDSGQRLLASLAVRVPDEAGRGPAARVGAEFQALADAAGGGDDDFGALRDPGRSLRQAITSWRIEFPWEDADWLATEETSQGVGPSIAGFVAALEPDPVATAELLVRLSHCHCVAVAGAVAVASAVRLCREAGNGKKFDGEGVARRLVAEVEAFEEGYIARELRGWKEIGWGRPPSRLCDRLAPLPSLIREAHDDLAVKSILATAADHQPEGHIPSHVQHGFAGASLVWALYRALGNLPPRRAVEDVLPRGGQSGAVGAVVAGLRVARSGVEALPDEWWNGLIAGPWVEKLVNAPSTAVFEEWREAEIEWNGREDRMRAPLREALRKQQALSEERARNHAPASRPKPVQEKPFAPPPQLGLADGDEEDPQKKKILRALRGKRRIDWKEDRRRDHGGWHDD